MTDREKLSEVTFTVWMIVFIVTMFWRFWHEGSLATVDATNPGRFNFLYFLAVNMAIPFGLSGMAAILTFRCGRRLWPTETALPEVKEEIAE